MEKFLTFSGYEKGIVGKYNMNTEEIKLYIDFIACDSNANIKEVEDNKFCFSFWKKWLY